MPPLWWVVAMALTLVAGVLSWLSLSLPRRQAVKPATLSPQQVMRNTRNTLPTEYREWFDWTAQMAGFEEPKRPAVVGRPQWNEAQHKGHDYMTLTDMYGTVDRYCVDTRKHEPTPRLPTVYRTCPDNTCNTTYGPGAGWTHTDQHTWVEMQT